ncbi:hypothetical protein F5B22DRAFT_595914 [Xylaria bambusicola]|uniref:uncharacterized protein n=1 Tax=Xylaria bambusicola TaxID=326684 RepID=UPI0020088AF9|nr:uncharacterized protein F5B22DRAFT_595914 [Xylaria bambusicola]KAI0521702.1 hypothetical protein F5B22DRAFT_595914 [Xylaria bambusicola]
MVSLWPWKGDGLSPAEFEKTLATLSTKITNTQAQLEQVRNSSRRIKLLWTLYLSFGYLVYAIVLTLVVGWQNLGPWEWTGMAGGPVLIYVVRTVANAYYSFRLDTLESRLKDRQAERAKTIQKLKDATRYDSTLELLEKYGGSNDKRNKVKKQKDGTEGAPTPESDVSRKKHRQSIDSSHLTGRTHLPPPPTANIQRPSTASGLPPNRQDQFPSSRLEPIPSSPQHQPIEEFAPNAGPLPPTYNQYENPGPPRWYDRILDLMLGEDETAPKNRIVLICQKCRLVNGQAPPGVRNVAELGAWKCMGCGATNGEMDEGKKIIQEVLGAKSTSRDESRSADERDTDRSSDVVKVEQEGDDNTQSEAETRRNMQEFRAKRRDKKSQMVP